MGFLAEVKCKALWEASKDFWCEIDRDFNRALSWNMKDRWGGVVQVVELFQMSIAWFTDFKWNVCEPVEFVVLMKKNDLFQMTHVAWLQRERKKELFFIINILFAVFERTEYFTLSRKANGFPYYFNFVFASTKLFLSTILFFKE